jgi:hypothetical protein
MPEKTSGVVACMQAIMRCIVNDSEMKSAKVVADPESNLDGGGRIMYVIEKHPILTRIGILIPMAIYPCLVKVFRQILGLCRFVQRGGGDQGDLGGYC